MQRTSGQRIQNLFNFLVKEELQKKPARKKEASTPISTRAIFIANPSAGSYLLNSRHFAEIIADLRAHGWQVTLKLTAERGDAAKIAREAVEQHMHVVVAIGGDGTIHEIIQELAGSDTALGILPSGTVNVWAREIGVPLDLRQAGHILATEQIRTIDLGKINDQYFLLMSGIGLDGEITQAVEKRSVKHFGVIGYCFTTIWFMIRYPAFRVVMRIKDRTIKINALQIIVGNTQLYGGMLKYTWRARCDDGLLDICIVRKRNTLGRLQVFLDFLFRRKQRSQWVRYETGNEIRLYTRKPIAIQVDGEPFGYTSTGSKPTILHIAPRALKVLVPQRIPLDLFTETTETEETA